jgi:hypothetical protein
MVIRSRFEALIWRGDMAFVVAASSRQPGSLGAFRAEKATAKAALETARGLIDQGLDNVTITDGNGRVYAPSEFDEFHTE